MIPLQWKTIQKTVDELIPQEINPRVMTDKQMSDLKRSLSKYGLVEIPAIDFNGKILAGHMRMKAMKLLGRGSEIIDVRYPNRKLTEKESQQYLIASNKISGDWDTELLKSFSFSTLEFAGFDMIELGNLWDKESEVVDDNFEVEKELKKITKPTTKLGDIITLGKNRIICGDSTKPETLARLFGKDRASMVYSDPIYNISVNYSGGIGGKANYGGNVNDTRTFEEYKKFLKDSMECALTVSDKDTHVFYWCDQVYIGVVQDIYRSLNLINKRVCLWLKNSQNPVPGVAFNKAYEPVVYAIRGKPYLADINNLNEVLNKELTTGNNLLDEINDIWMAKRLSAQDYEHATSKPPQLHEKAIKRCTKPNDIILDSFLGSGSTLIAGENLGRRVYGCELEPQFCDLIIRRYEKLTGKKAKIEHYEESSVRKKFIEELEKTPIISVACEKVGISRNTFYRWLKEESYFALDVDKAMNMGVSLVSDFAESNVLNGIKNKDSKYTMYWLSHRHSEYKRQFIRDNEKEHYKAESREKRIKILEADIETQKWFDGWIREKKKMDKIKEDEFKKSIT